MNNSQNPHKFELELTGEFTVPDVLAALMNGEQPDEHKKADKHAAIFEVGMKLLAAELTHIMIMRGLAQQSVTGKKLKQFEWDQEVFSLLGDDLKGAVKSMLEQASEHMLTK